MFSKPNYLKVIKLLKLIYSYSLNIQENKVNKNLNANLF